MRLIYKKEFINSNIIFFSKISPPGWFMPKAYYENNNIMMAYKDMAMGILTLMNSSYSEESLSDEIDKMIELERKMAQVGVFCFNL